MIKILKKTVTLVFLLLLGSPMVSSAQELDTEVRPSWWASLLTTPLFDAPATGEILPDGWTVVGGPATFEFKTTAKGQLEVHGYGSAPRNAFLTSPDTYGDFLLEFDVLINKDGGNSGVQIRSTIDGPRMFGYQIEIDPSDRAWSAGLYDEGRRGWLASLQDNVDARDAFAPGDWNHYKILAIGPRIRTWINDVPAVDHLDFVDAQGRFGFQVHSGKCDVRWRNIRIADLGKRTEVTLLDASQHDGFRITPENGLSSQDGGWSVNPEGVRLESVNPISDVPSVLTITSTVGQGLLFIEMGDVINGPGYSLKIPAPLGSADTPGVIRILRFADRLQVLVDNVPLVPGPPDISGDLPLSLSCSLDTDAVIHRISIDLPSKRESMWIKKIQESWSDRTGTVSPGP
ncbi:MAG: DUF1080 domain-containing protein [Phycisphaerales bacterium]|nr:DUF1080 domain-containing protein [Phycisphaerales bacterium]